MDHLDTASQPILKFTSKSKFLCSLFVLLIFSVSFAWAPASAQTGQTLQGCPVFPADSIWNTPIENLPVDPNSSAYISTIGATQGLHPDFGSGAWNGGPIGIPYTVVSGTQAKVNITFDYSDESDPGPYPIPPDAAIEGGSQSTGDRHVLVLDRDNCILYEVFSAYPQPDGSWQAGSGAVFNLRSNSLRPRGWTSADAAGLPILPGLARYDEVASGEIRHALRFTAPQTRKEYLWPARHYASSLTASNYPPMGQRFRLKAAFDVSFFSPEVQVILRALKKYGMILADNGSSWYISGAPDPRWNNDKLVSELRQVTGSNFEAVDQSSLMVSADSGQALQTVSSDPIPPTGGGGGGGASVGSGGGGGGGGGGCFIATAAYGSPLDSRVILLRAFRDKYLASNRVGRSLIRWYSSVSPPAAAKVRESPFLRGLVGGILWPIVFSAWLMLHPWAGAAFLLGGGILLGVFLSGRKKSNRKKGDHCEGGGAGENHLRSEKECRRAEERNERPR